MAEGQELTEFQKQLDGEDMGEFHVKDALLCQIFRDAQAYLMLKPTNSVRLLFTMHLRGELARKAFMGTPMLVRMRISRLAARDDGKKVEWRFASTFRDEAATGVDLKRVDACFVDGFPCSSPMAFLGNQCGKGIVGWRWHFPDVEKIDFVMQMREPLGALVVMEGSTEGGTFSPGGVVEISQCLRRVSDHPSLSEI